MLHVMRRLGSSWPRLLSPDQRHWNVVIRASLRSRKPLVPLLVALVLCLVAFLLLTASEAWAEEQPNQTQMTRQDTTVESKMMVDGKEVLEPLPTALPAVPSPDETAPVQAAHPVRTETPSPPSTASPSTAPAQTITETDYLASQRPVPHQFAVMIVNGEVVESDPAIQEPPPGPTPTSGDGWWSAPQPAAPDQYGPKTASNPKPVSPSSSDGGYAPETASWPVPGKNNPLPAAPSVSSDHAPQASEPISWPALKSEPDASEENAPLAEPAGEPSATLMPPPADTTGLGSAALPRSGRSDATPIAPQDPIAAGQTPLATGSTVPMEVWGVASHLPTTLGTATSTMSNAMSSAAEIVGDAAAGIAAGISGTLANGSVEPSSNDGTHDPSQEEEAPQPPTTPLAPPVGGSSSFSLSGGQLGSAGVAPLLLVGVLASGLVLLRRSGWRYLASYEVPKPSSALLLPLERPG